MARWVQPLAIGAHQAGVNTIKACPCHQANCIQVSGFRHGGVLNRFVAMYPATMIDKNPTTESFPDASRWLDQLEDAAALRVMAEDQLGAIEAIRAELPAIEAAATAAFQRLNDAADTRLFYAGAGTSIRVGVQDGVELTPTYGWPADRTGFLIAGGAAALMRSVEGAEDSAEAGVKAVREASLDARSVLIGIAASGSTPYTCAAITEARSRGALTIGLANNPGSKLVAAAEFGITLATGGEVVAGSTRMKAGTAQKICLNMISTLIMVRMGKVRNGLMVAMQASNDKLRRRQIEIDAALKPAAADE